MRIIFNILKVLLIGGFIIYLVSLIAIIIFQEKMIFMPESLPENYRYEFDAAFEEIYLDTEDGARLNALHFKVENPQGAVLYYHGNAGELASWGKVVQKFVNRNYDVLVMDYRTYGKSTGSLSENKLYADAQLFYDYLSEIYSEKDIVLYGRSLGTTFAAYVASKNNPRMLILEAPFYSLEKVASDGFSIYPVRWFLKYHFPTHLFMPRVNAPIVIFHGTDDSMIDYENSIELAELIDPDKLQLISIPNANHNDLENFPEYKKALDEILK